MSRHVKRGELASDDTKHRRHLPYDRVREAYSPSTPTCSALLSLALPNSTPQPPEEHLRSTTSPWPIRHAHTHRTPYEQCLRQSSARRAKHSPAPRPKALHLPANLPYHRFTCTRRNHVGGLDASRAGLQACVDSNIIPQCCPSR